MTGPLRVLFVCTANICRSPSMQLIADHLAGGALEVSSAGTHGYDGHPMNTEMTGPLLARGVPAAGVESFASRPLTPDLVAEADLVLTAEEAHRRFVAEAQPGAARTVFTLGQFAAAVGDAGDATGVDLVRAIGSRTHGDRSHDLADPYRRGPEAAERCAQQIEQMLRVVVPVLTRSGRISA